MAKANAAATRALELDNRLAEAHAALAYRTVHHDWDWATAEAQFQRAFNPQVARQREVRVGPAEGGAPACQGHLIFHDGDASAARAASKECNGQPLLARVGRRGGSSDPTFALILSKVSTTIWRSASDSSTKS
jgi:hypothetical protein